MLGTNVSQAFWVGAGFFAQTLFGARLLLQWLCSEVRGRSIVPNAFWYLSVAGGAILLCYAIHRGELVFISGEAMSLLIFLRNLQLLSKGGNRR